LNILKQNNYLYITDIQNFTEAAAACAEYYGQDYFAVVFEADDGLKLSEAEKKALLELPFITAVKITDRAGICVNDLMAFDLRFSQGEIALGAEDSDGADRKRFEVLFGKNRAHRFFSSDEKTETGYFAVSSESCDEYFTRIFREKSALQNKLITECLVSLRTGDTVKGFEKEGINFYKLIKDKTKE